MPLKHRTKAIEAFQKDPPTTVFLISMRSGAGESGAHGHVLFGLLLFATSSLALSLKCERLGAVGAMSTVMKINSLFFVNAA